MAETPLPGPLPEEVPEERRGRHRMWAWFIAGLIVIALLALVFRPSRSTADAPLPNAKDTIAQ